jgi:hypothetical protein
MATNDTLQGWVNGPPPERDDGAFAVVELARAATIDGQEHFGDPMIVRRWSGKLKTTAGAHRLSYDDVLRHIDIAA